MRFRSWVRTGSISCVAATAIISGCGGSKGSATPDSQAADDAALDAATLDGPTAADAALDAQSPDAGPAVDGGPTTTAITIRAFADSFPSFTGVTENVPLLAFQDGDGAWTALTGTNGVYHATAKSQLYGVAVGCGTALVNLAIYYQSISDTTDLGVDGCFRAPTDTADVTVSVVNNDARQSTLAVGVVTTSTPITGNATIHLAVPKRMADVFAVSVADSTGSPAAAIAYRGPTLNVTGNVPLSIDMASAQELEKHPLTVVGAVPAGHSETSAEVVSEHYTTNSYGLRFLLREPLTRTDPNTIATHYQTVAETSRQTSDVLYARAHTRGTTPAGFGYDRVVDVETATPVALTMTLPDVFTADAPTVDNAPIPHATAKFPMRAPTLGHAIYQLDLVTAKDATTKRTVDIIIRPGWAQGAPIVTIATPDLSALPGWTADMALFQDTNVDWTMLVDDRNIAFGAPIVAGKRILETFLFATIQRSRSPGPALSTQTAAGASCTGVCGARRDRFAP